MAQYIETHLGLPNTCFKCGEPIPEGQPWYAEHEDAARAGLGLCAACAHGGDEKPKAKRGKGKKEG